MDRNRLFIFLRIFFDIFKISTSSLVKSGSFGAGIKLFKRFFMELKYYLSVDIGLSIFWVSLRLEILTML